MESETIKLVPITKTENATVPSLRMGKTNLIDVKSKFENRSSGTIVSPEIYNCKLEASWIKGKFDIFTETDETNALETTEGNT